MSRRAASREPQPRQSGCVGVIVLAGAALVAIVTGLWRAFNWGARFIAYWDASREAEQHAESEPPRISASSWAKGYGAMVAVVLAIVVVGALVLNKASEQTSVSDAPTNTPYISPTWTPSTAQTKTPSGPHILVSPTLGGTEDAFNATYGAQTSEWTWQATIAGQPVKIYADMGPQTETSDGQLHSYVVDVTVPDSAIGREAWSPQAANTIFAAFLPADARHVSDGAGAQPGEVDHIYVSAELAATFHADMFTNEFGTATDPPGTLHAQCTDYPSNSANLGECYISVGTQY